MIELFKVWLHCRLHNFWSSDKHFIIGIKDGSSVRFYCKCALPKEIPWKD